MRKTHRRICLKRIESKVGQSGCRQRQTASPNPGRYRQRRLFTGCRQLVGPVLWFLAISPQESTLSRHCRHPAIPKEPIAGPRVTDRSERRRGQCAGVACRCGFSPAVRGRPAGGVLEALMGIVTVLTVLHQPHLRLARTSHKSHWQRSARGGLPKLLKFHPRRSTIRQRALSNTGAER
jgi:hypothetical protein